MNYLLMEYMNLYITIILFHLHKYSVPIKCSFYGYDVILIDLYRIIDMSVSYCFTKYINIKII